MGSNPFTNGIESIYLRSANKTRYFSAQRTLRDSTIGSVDFCHKWQMISKHQPKIMKMILSIKQPIFYLNFLNLKVVANLGITVEYLGSYLATEIF